MGKKSRKKEASAAAAPIQQPASSPGWSGLETAAMRALGCSLVLAPNTPLSAAVVVLEPGKARVRRDNSLGETDEKTHFAGARLLQLTGSGRGSGTSELRMPFQACLVGEVR